MAFFVAKYNTRKLLLFLSNISNARDFCIYYKKLYYIEEKYFIKYFYFKKEFDEKHYNKKKKTKFNNTKKVSKKLKINLLFNSIYNKSQIINFRYNNFNIYSEIDKKIRYKEINNIFIFIF